MTLLVLLLACKGEELVPEQGNLAHIATDVSAYPAFEVPAATLRDGIHGIVKLTAEHSFVGAGGSGSFTAQGAGALLVDGPEWYVVTARHVVIPNTQTTAVRDVELGKLEEIGTRVTISGLGIEPTSLEFSATEDIAFLRVAPGERGLLQSVAALDPAAPIPVRPRASEVRPGRTVEAWGFPGSQHPQVQTPAISAADPRYFVLNQALLRGYSGGPVFVARGDQKTIAGVIIRADDKSEQTTVLDWSVALSVLEGDSTSLSVPGRIDYDGVSLVARPKRPVAEPSEASAEVE